MTIQHPSRARGVYVAIGVFTLAITLLTGAGSPATANSDVTRGVLIAPHADLESSIPKDKDTLATIPRELRLKFTEAPELPVTRVKLRGPRGADISLGRLRTVDTAKMMVVAPITGMVSAGTYTVDWETAGEDGHVVDGFFVFTVLPGADSAPLIGRGGRSPDPAMVHHDSTSMTAHDGRFGAESTGYVVVRFFLYAALLVVIGTVAFRAVVLPLSLRRPDVDAAFIADAAHRAAAIGWVTGWLLLAVCVARLIAQSLALNGPDAMFDAARIDVLIRETKWGRAWIVQIAATLMALYGFTIARRSDEPAAPRRKGWPRASSRTGWVAAGIAVSTLAFTPAFAGHAAASPDLRALALLFTGLHVIGAAGWLGSLFVVLVAGFPAAMALADDRRGPGVRTLINAFSPAALGFAALVTGTGLFAAWLHVGTFGALWDSRYGNLLLTKLAVLSVVALTGAYNWRRVKPTLGTSQGAARIHRSATVEVAIAIVILLITAILVATPPAAGNM